jgi:hypothetical protein
MGDIKEADVREALERLILSGMNSSPPSRRASCICWRSGLMSAKTVSKSACGPRDWRIWSWTSARQTRTPEGGVMTDPNVTGDGRTVTIRIRISIRKRGGRKLVLAPDGTPDAGPVLVVVQTHFFESDRHGEPKICPEFRSGQPRGIRPGSPAPISIAVAHLPLRASGSDE